MRNKLRANIPPELGLLRSLAELSLAQNELVGAIPPEVTRSLREPFRRAPPGLCRADSLNGLGPTQGLERK